MNHLINTEKMLVLFVLMLDSTSDSEFSNVFVFAQSLVCRKTAVQSYLQDFKLVFF